MEEQTSDEGEEGVGSNVPDANKTKKRVITYVEK